jgi:chromosome segregation ATPase
MTELDAKADSLEATVRVLETEKKSLKSEMAGIHSYKSQYETSMGENKRLAAKYDRLEKEKHDLLIECADYTKQLHAVQDRVIQLENETRQQTELNQDLNKQYVQAVKSNKAVDSELQVGSMSHAMPCHAMRCDAMRFNAVWHNMFLTDGIMLSFLYSICAIGEAVGSG